MYRILIVEDNEKIRMELCDFLSKNGYLSEGCSNFQHILEDITSRKPDLILLDLNLPFTDGHFICKELRKTSNVPIIIVTSRNSEIDELQSMHLGADDYVTKPFNPLELVARVKSQLRRYTKLGNLNTDNNAVFRAGGLVINDETKEVTVDGESVKLTPIEYNILKLLMKNQGRVFSINQIYESIWNEEAIGADNTVAVHIRHIREKIEINPKDPQYLKVVWGIGYKVEKL